MINSIFSLHVIYPFPLTILCHLLITLPLNFVISNFVPSHRVPDSDSDAVGDTENSDRDGGKDDDSEAGG
jgi:hypothetical protein